jgi:hypothetical protein
MKSICSLTNITYPVPEFTFLSSKNYPHPIFSLPVKPLIAMAGKWSSGELDENEKRLLFVALLKKLDLVIFRSPAEPTLKTMEQNFELLSQLVIWKTNALLPNLSSVKLPSFIVEYPTTHTLEKIRVFLKILLDAKNGYQSKYLSNYHLRSTSEMRANEEKLKRLINSGIRRNNGNYEKNLAIFALGASGILSTDHRYDFWIELFQVKEPDIYQISPKHFHKMQEFLQLELEGYIREADIRALKVLSHVQGLVDIVNKGPAAYYDIHDISLTHASEYLSQLHNSMIDPSVSLEKPTESQFKDKLGRTNLVNYMTALSKWRKAMEYRRLMTEKTNEMKKTYQSVSLEESKDTEDMGIDMDRLTPIDMLIETGVSGIEIMIDSEE